MTKPVDKINNILSILLQLYPNAETGLHFNSDFELLVAVILSAQCTDSRVNVVTSSLFAKYPTIYDINDLPLELLEDIIRPVGLYHSKAKNIKLLASILIREYKGKVPCEFEELLKLPGVGRKTANVVRAVGFHLPGFGVDTHVYRVCHRLGLSNGSKPENIEIDMKRMIPEKLWGDAHHWFILHGRKYCKARKPNCLECPLSEYCDNYKKNKQLP